MSSFFSKLKLHNILILSLLVIGAFLRLFDFQESVEFNSDFGRDSLFAMRILTEKPTLLGAQASAGGFFLGPLYFYGIALVYLLVGFTPQIVSLVFISLNVLAAYLIYVFLRKNVSKAAGVFGLALFTFNPLLILSARGATHVPMMPIITVLSMIALYQSLVKKKVFWHLVSGLAFGLFFHVHFTSLLLLPGYFLAVFLWSGKSFKEKIYALVFHGLGMVLMLTPLILFDVRHSLINFKSFVGYLLSSAKGESITENLQHWTPSEKITNLAGVFTKTVVLQALLLIIAAAGLKKSLKEKLLILSLPNLLSLMFVGMFIFYMFYSGYLYTYYLVIPVTLGILLFAVGLAKHSSLILSSLLVIAIGFLSFTSIKSIYRPTYRTVAGLSRITHMIEDHVDQTSPESFTIFKDSRDGLTSLGYEYRFLLQRDGYVVAPELEYNIAEAMYVIQEDGDSDPLTIGNWEVSQFKPVTLEKLADLEIRGKRVKLFVLYR
jgi:hypothetical protein